MAYIQQLPYQPHQDFTLESCLFLGFIVLVGLFFGRKWFLQDNRSKYPEYDEIPDTILSHIPKRSELQELDNSVDVVIIGSGIGGLATANILSRFGYKVVVFEQHYRVGGSTHVYKTKEFDFDVGVHYVGGQMDKLRSPFRKIFDWLSDGKLQWSRIAEVYDVAYNSKTGQRLEFTGNPKLNRKSILAHFPDVDAKALDLYYKKCRTARFVAYMAFAAKVLPPVATRFLWNFIGFGRFYRRHSLGTTYDVMHSCGLGDDVIGALAYSYGDYGTPPNKSPFFVQAFMENHYDGGAFFPRGGSSSIPKTLIAPILRRGGYVFASSPVDEILTKRKLFSGGYKAIGVKVKGVEIRAKKCVVSDAGFSKTFDIVDGHRPMVDPIAGATQLALVHKKEAQNPMVPSAAFFYLFVGLNGTDKELCLPGQNIWHLKDWDHSKVWEILFDSNTVEESLHVKPPLVFLSNESAKDPDYDTRRPGKSTVTMIAWTDSHWFTKFKETSHGDRGEEYNEIKTKTTNTLLDILYHHFPMTKGRVTCAELGSPLSANKYLGRVSGEIYNLDHTESRFKTLEAQLALHPQTTVQNLYMTGQDVMAVSVEGATLGGCFAASRVSALALVVAILPIAVACIPWVVQ